MINREKFFLVACLLLFIFRVGTQYVLGQESAGTAADQAIDQGFRYLKSVQKSDGSFGSGLYESDAAVTALAGMAFLSAGEVKAQSPAGRCTNYLLSISQPNGFISRSAKPGSTGVFRPMYGHGFAILYLSEILGMAENEDLLPKLDRGVRLIISTQNDEGGWRYFPQKADSDVSVTSCIVMALRAARNAGRDVPSQTIDRAVQYILSCQNTDGGFMYMPPSGVNALPRSAAAASALLCAGKYDSPETARAIAWLNAEAFRAFAVSTAPTISTIPTVSTASVAAAAGLGTNQRFQGDYPFYAAYYLTGVYVQQNTDFTRWHDHIVPRLVKTQQPNGSWVSDFSPEYATAIALIVLLADRHYLPVWQR